MSKKYPIINPKASCVIGMYVDERVGMDHPIASMRFTITMQACLCYQQAVPLKDAIQSILSHIRYLFGKDIPDELVVSTVSLIYAEQSALQSIKPKKAIDTIIANNCQSVRQWVLFNRRFRKSVDIKTHKYWPFYPKATLSGLAAGAVAWRSKLKIFDNTTQEELLAEVTEKVMGSDYIVRGGSVNWSESDQIRIVKTSHPRFTIREFPHIKTYNCILYYPKHTTKETLVENAARIAATWCPKACVVWSPSKTTWPKKDENASRTKKSNKKK